MELAVIYFISFCLAFGTPTETASETDTVAAEATHVKSIHIPYRSPVHVTGYAPATSLLEAPILKSHSYATEIKHLLPVGVGPAPAVAAVPLKSSLVGHRVTAAESVPVVPVEVAPAPAVVPADGPVKSIKAFSFASEVKHEVPVAAPVAEAHVKSIHAPVVAAPVAEAHLKSIHAPVVAAPVAEAHVKSIHAPAVAAHVVAPVVPAPAIVHAEGPVKSIRAFSYATEVKHEVPVAAVRAEVHAPVVAAPVAGTHVKSIHASVVAAPVAGAHVKSIHAPVVAAPVAGAHVKSIHAPVVATPVAGAHVKSIHSPAIAALAPAVAPVAPAPSIVHAEGPIKSSAIKAFSYATEVKHEVPVSALPAPVAVAPAAEAHVKSIHSPIVAAPVAQTHVKSIHAPVLTTNHISVQPVVGPQAIVHRPVVAKSIHAPTVGAKLLAPAIRSPISHSYITTLRHRTPTFGAHAPALSAAGLLGARYSHAGHLVRRLPISARINHGLYGRHYGYFPRLYASLAAPGATLWGGHPISSGVSYLGGISRGAFGYHPIPVHYQHYRSPVLGVWNYFHR